MYKKREKDEILDLCEGGSEFHLIWKNTHSISNDAVPAETVREHG
jgi:hypothetical protein